MAKQRLEKVIEIAAKDIADSLSPDSHPGKKNAVANFLIMALWTAATAAEEVEKSSDWVDATKDDGWIGRQAEEKEKYDLPDDLSDDKIGAIYRILGQDVDALRAIIPPRIKLEPELEAQIQQVIGVSPVPTDGKSTTMTQAPSLGDSSTSMPATFESKKEQDGGEPAGGGSATRELDVPPVEEIPEPTGKVENVPDEFEKRTSR